MSTSVTQGVGLRSAKVENLEQRCLLSADLMGIFAGAIPSSLSTGGKNRIVVSITNSGDSAFRGPVSVALFLSSDAMLDTGDTLLATTHAQVRLGAGQSRRLTVEFATPIATTDGNDFLLGRVEGDGRSTTFASATPVAVRQPFVDLVTEFVYLPTGSIHTNGNTANRPWTAVRVVNIGNTVARGVVKVGFFLAPGTVLNASAALASQSKPARVQLRPGGSKLFAAQLVLPAGSLPGSYTLFGVATPLVGALVRHPEDLNAAAAQNVSVVSSVPMETLLANYHRHDHRRCIYYDGSDFAADTEADFGMNEAVVPGDSIPDGFEPEPGPATSPASQPTTQPSNDTWDSDLSSAAGDVSAAQAASGAGNTDSPGSDWGADSGGDSGGSSDGGDSDGDSGGDDGDASGDDGGDDGGDD